MDETSPRYDIFAGAETWTPLTVNVPVSVLSCEAAFNALQSHCGHLQIPVHSLLGFVLLLSFPILT